MLNAVPGLLPDSTISCSKKRTHGSPAASNITNSPSQLVNLADTTTLESLVDAYFGWYNPSYPILHEKTFREKFQSRHQVHPRSSWYVIFHLVLAIGHWIVGEESEAEQSKYYMAARSCMSMRMLESGTLLTVQACLLMVDLPKNFPTTEASRN
jgi:transcriptional regulatory protein GAL4